MKRLSYHIISLLRLYDSVALPGFGVFNIGYSPAHYDRDTFSFFPPSFILAFTPDENAASKVLRDSYVRKERLSLEEAESLLKADLSSLRMRMIEEGEALLPGLGSLSLTDEGMIFSSSFCLNPQLPVLFAMPLLRSLQEIPNTLEEDDEPQIESTLLSAFTDSLDPSLQLPMFGNADEISEEDPESSQFTASAAEEEYTEPSKEVVAGDHEEIGDVLEVTGPKIRREWHPDYYYIPIHKKLAKIAACFLLVIIVAIAAFLPVERPQNTPSAAAIIPISVEEPSVDTLATALEKEVGLDSCTVNPDSLSARPSMPIRMKESQPLSNRYYAIVAAFKTEKEAEKFIASHPKEASHIEVIKNRHFHLISVSSASDKETLESHLPLIRVTYPDAWVYILPNP